MKLENEFLLVEIAAQGAEVTRIFNKKDETDVLWEGNPVFWCRHSPLLFPYVGKTYQNKLWIDGKRKFSNLYAEGFRGDKENVSLRI